MLTNQEDGVTVRQRLGDDLLTTYLLRSQDLRFWTLLD